MKKILLALFIIYILFLKKIADIVFFSLALLLLIACVIVGFMKEQVLLETLAVWCYLFLFLGLFFAILEYIREVSVQPIKNVRRFQKKKINIISNKRRQKK